MMWKMCIRARNVDSVNKFNLSALTWTELHKNQLFNVPNQTAGYLCSFGYQPPHYAPGEALLTSPSFHTALYYVAFTGFSVPHLP